MEKDISIVVPIYKDIKTIEKTIDRLLDFFGSENLNGEIVIVNDGGSDGSTLKVKEKMKNNDSVLLIDRDINKGKGYTVREGLKKASGRSVFYTDADLPYGIEPIKEMYKRLSSNQSDLILANRNLSGKGGIKEASLIRKITHAVYSLLVGSLVCKYSDTQAGLKGMNRSIINNVIPFLTIDRFSFDVELILLTKKKGFKIGEIPVILETSGKSNLNIIFDAPKMIKDLLKIAIRNKFGFYDKK
jgi:dolichyl-phosphate beta-glucosyltransferase